MKWMVLLFALLLLAACGGDNLTGSVVDVDSGKVIETSNDEDKKREVGNLITGLVAKERGTVEKDETKQRKEIEDDLQAIYAERTEVLTQKRIILGLLSDPETIFEERQEYQKDLDVLRARESELTLRARILDTKLETEKKRVGEAERVEAYKKLVKNLEEDREEFLSKLKEVGQEILDLRVEMLETDASYDKLDSLRSDLDPLEREENNLLKNLRTIEEELEEKLDYLGDVEEGVYKSYESLILERNRIVEEIGVVKNSIVEQYLKLKNGDPSGAAEAQERIEDLENQEEDLEDELHEVTTELEG